MAGDTFKRMSLDELAYFRNGKSISPERYSERGKYPVFGANGQIARSDDVLNTEAVVVIGRVGAYCGSVHYIPEPSWVTDNAIVATPKAGNDVRFLYYLLGGLELRRTAIGSAQPLMTQGGLKVLQTTVPPLKQQQAIAYILGALDDKIELNRRMNETLEAMARAIFKSWFVDFDPVRAKAEGQQPPGLAPHIADLFPDAFEESELGEIPKGWIVGVIGDIAFPAIGGQWGKEKPEEGLIPAICLRGCDMEDLRKEGYASKAPVRFVKKDAVKKRLPTESELLIAASGAGPCGRPLWCSLLIRQHYCQPVIYSNFVKKFSTPGPEYAVYLDRLLFEKFVDKSIQDFITGTSVPNLDSKGLLASCRIVIPPKQILEVFYSHNQPVFQKLYSKENVVLREIRDTLLPKLISGELRVPDADRIVGRAL